MQAMFIQALKSSAVKESGCVLSVTRQWDEKYAFLLRGCVCFSFSLSFSVACQSDQVYSFCFCLPIYLRLRIWTVCTWPTCRTSTGQKRARPSTTISSTSVKSTRLVPIPMTRSASLNLPASQRLQW